LNNHTLKEIEKVTESKTHENPEVLGKRGVGVTSARASLDRQNFLQSYFFVESTILFTLKIMEL